VQLAWAACLLIFFAAAAWRGQTFTDYGHLSAALIGLGLYPLGSRQRRSGVSPPRGQSLDRTMRR
jgi:hypothetical protein